MPWLARYQPEIDWLARSVRRRADYDVSEVSTHLLVAPSPHVAVVDLSSTTQLSQRVCNGPRCLTCATTIVDPTSGPSSRARENTRNYAVEQRLPHKNIAVDQRFPPENYAVGEVSPSEPSCSETSASSSGSRRLRKSQRNRSGRRRLRRRAPTVEPVQHREVLNVVEYEGGSPNRVRTIDVASSPSDAATITRLPGLSWKHFLRDLKAGEIEQICLLTSSDQPAVLANTVSDDVSSSRPKAAEPKSVREERFAAQSWTALQDSNNPVYSLAREFEDIFPEKIPNVPPNGVFDSRLISCPARSTA
ncbi:unnamed protein product [Phytophthora fragariaefolia]|uniref:Unnamed protein product n=1 Tax=Phytophthora fragariaefolia TaxID=1490495 RepID=A0A9W6XVE8_9STRA|nr:unnamed protein product [Phytophthora fragariaefolia]